MQRAEISGIAEARIRKLMMMSVERASSDDPAMARRYVDLAIRISMRTKTKIPKEYIYCKGCLMPMIPAASRVRLRDHKVVMTCTECGRLKRMPYLREQRE
jgi:ribonuclease P protein subunit RPR2